MVKVNKIKRICRTILTAVLVSLIWLQGWASPAQAIAESIKPEASSDRIQAFAKCLPEELTLSNKDVGDRIARALGEMTNDQIERAFDLTDKPSLSNAESEFESCLQRQGITPARQLADS